MNLIRISLVFILTIIVSNAVAIEKCRWNNQKGIPCIAISKTSNTSSYNSDGVNKEIFTKQETVVLIISVAAMIVFAGIFSIYVFYSIQRYTATASSRLADRLMRYALAAPGRWRERHIYVLGPNLMHMWLLGNPNVAGLLPDLTL